MSMLRTTDEVTKARAATSPARTTPICEVPGHESMEADLVVGRI